MAAKSDDGDAPQGKLVLAAILIAGGLGLLALSFAWPHVASARRNWSLEQAREYQAVSAKLHELALEHSHNSQKRDDGAAREELAKAKADYDVVREKLDSAAGRPKHIALLMRLAGFVLASAGFIGFHFWRNKSAD